MSIDDYRITVESFGDEVPQNWEEIADYLNEQFAAALAALDESDTYYSRDAREAVDAIWERYWSGDLPGAPVPAE